MRKGENRPDLTLDRACSNIEELKYHKRVSEPCWMREGASCTWCDAQALWDKKVCFLQEEPTGWQEGETWDVNWKRHRRDGGSVWNNHSSAGWPMIKDGWVLSLKYLFNWCKPVPSLALTRSVGWRPVTRLKPAHLKNTHEDSQWVRSVAAGLRRTHSKASTHTDSNVTSQTSNACFSQCH